MYVFAPRRHCSSIVADAICGQVIDEVKKENFSLKLKIYFLEDRLSKLSPDQIDLALKENIELQVQCSTIRHELKRYKKLLFEAEEVITSNSAQREEAASSGNGGRRERELERMLHEERAAWERERVASEAKIKELMRDAAKRERGLDADDKVRFLLRISEANADAEWSRRNLRAFNSKFSSRRSRSLNFSPSNRISTRS